MGNSSGKEAREAPTHNSRSTSVRPTGSTNAGNPGGASSGSFAAQSYRPARTARRDTLLSLGSASDGSPTGPRRETRPEREARKAEKARQARVAEREQSLKEEHVDYGYLVTLGTYTGAEDFSKAVVRQLMIERRLAPFWRGLNDHSDSWTEHQLVAAANGLSIPPPDEIPPDDSSSPRVTRDSKSQPINVGGRNNPIDQSRNLDTVPSDSLSYPSGGPGPSAASQFFRGRSKTLASLTSARGSTPTLALREIALPHEPFLNGQRVQAHLYKDVQDCPICFLYYPPYLNRTRCCDQPICSECFVQIKRPDPHPPEHLDPNVPPTPEAIMQQDQGLLISEQATCPFCKQPEFGVSYEPPPFRRGLAYADHKDSSKFGKSASALSSSASLASSPASVTGRRRAQSLSPDASAVITTDRIRPDWSSKLAEARAQAARRAAAATALHTAAYSLGSEGFRFGLNRRRRLVHPDGRPINVEIQRTADGTPIPNIDALLAALTGPGPSGAAYRGTDDLLPSRGSSRQNQSDELEELMIMEAIRQSLIAEEERKNRAGQEHSGEQGSETINKAREEPTAAVQGLSTSTPISAYFTSRSYLQHHGSPSTLPNTVPTSNITTTMIGASSAPSDGRRLTARRENSESSTSRSSLNSAQDSAEGKDSEVSAPPSPEEAAERCAPFGN